MDTVIHFNPDVLRLSELQLSQLPNTLFYDTLYDTRDYQLLTQRLWLWKRDDKWRLKIRNEKNLLIEGQENVSQFIETILGENWESKLLDIVTLKTTRLYTQDNDIWIDYVGWGRFKIGYYAVAGIKCNSLRDIEYLLSDLDVCVLPSKAIVCLDDIQQTSEYTLPLEAEERNLLKMARLLLARSPVFGPEIDSITFSDDEE